MGAFASALQGIGGVGEDAAVGKQTFDDWKRQQTMDKLNLLISQTNLQGLQDRLKKASLSENLGFTTGPNGEQLAIQRDPATGGITTKQIVAPPDTSQQKTQAAQLIAALPEQLRSIAQGVFNMGGPKALEDFAGKAGLDVEKVKTKVPQLKFDKDTPYITDSNGTDWAVDDPNIPPELKQIAETAKKIRTQNQGDEANKTAQALQRQFELMDARDKLKERDEFRKVVKRGIAGHSLLRTIQAQVENAERTGGVGTQAGDLALTESYIQTMFGFDPKGVRNNQKLQEATLYQKGVDDKVIGWYHAVTGGGTLSQDVRQQMLDAAKTQVASWDQTVNESGGIATDDAEIKKALDYYNRITSNDVFSPNPAVPPPPVPGATVRVTH
jgi:hypothetical protein